MGGYIGGHIVFKYGYMVNYNAFARGKRAAEFTPVLPAAEVPENTPTKVAFGATAVMLVRRGDVVHALKETCSHAGGPLSQGELRRRHDHLPVACVGLPPHRWRGRARSGPSRQVSYRARVNDGQVELQGPHD